MELSKSNVPSSINDKRFPWHKDMVGDKGMCKMYLCYRPIEASPPENNTPTSEKPSYYQTLSSQIPLNSSAFLSPMFSHWALVIEWDESMKDEDGDPIFPRTVTYEAFDNNGKLMPNWKEGTPAGSGGTDNWTRKYLGEKKLSPKEINQAAFTLNLNGKEYNATNMNCQIWIKALWKILMKGDLEVTDLSFLTALDFLLPGASSLMPKKNE